MEPWKRRSENIHRFVYFNGLPHVINNFTVFSIQSLIFAVYSLYFLVRNERGGFTLSYAIAMGIAHLPQYQQINYIFIIRLLHFHTQIHTNNAQTYLPNNSRLYISFDGGTSRIFLGFLRRRLVSSRASSAELRKKRSASQIKIKYMSETFHFMREIRSFSVAVGWVN